MKLLLNNNWNHVIFLISKNITVNKLERIEMNSFSSEVKKELSQINNLSKKELVRAELFGYLITSSSNSFTTQSEYNINRFGKLLTNVGKMISK